MTFDPKRYKPGQWRGGGDVSPFTGSGEIRRWDVDFEHKYGFSFLNTTNAKELVKSVRAIRDREMKTACIEELLSMHGTFKKDDRKRELGMIESSVRELWPWVRFYDDDDLPIFTPE